MQGTMESVGRRGGEVPRPDLVEGGIVLAAGEIDLGVDDVREARARERERGHDAFRDDELGLELDRLATPLRAFRHQRRRGDAVAPRLVADRHRGDAGNEDEVADRQRRRIAGGGAALELLVPEVLDLEAFLRHHRHRLDVHVGRRQREASLRDRGRGRNAAAQEFPPHILVGRHRLDRGVVLVGAHQVGALGAGRAQHGVEIVEDARGLLLALGEARMRQALRYHVGRDAGDEILRHQAGGEHPASGPHALRELDLAGAELHRQQRLRGAGYARLVHEVPLQWTPEYAIWADANESDFRCFRCRTVPRSVCYPSPAGMAIAYGIPCDGAAVESGRAAGGLSHIAPSPTRTRACPSSGTSRVGRSRMKPTSAAGAGTMVAQHTVMSEGFASERTVSRRPFTRAPAIERCLSAVRRAGARRRAIVRG